MSCELVCVCVLLVRVVIICPASTHTALVSSPSLTVLRLSIHQEREIFIKQQEITTLTVIWARQLVSPQPKLGPVP